MAGRFGVLRRHGWQVFSLGTGVAFLASIVGISMVWNNGWTLLGFYAGVIVAWAWVSALSARTRSELPGA